MSDDVTQGEAIVITGRDNIEHARWLRVRMALKLEISTGMRRSNRGRSTLALANEITGKNLKNKRAAYIALNEKIVAEMGETFNKPI